MYSVSTQFFDWYWQYQSKNCGHRIQSVSVEKHVLFMMYDLYWYCQMKKKRMIMKILKKEWFIWKFWKKEVVEKRGRRKRNPCACDSVDQCRYTTFFWLYFSQTHFSNFLFTNLFSLQFLYFFIISSLSTHAIWC